MTYQERKAAIALVLPYLDSLQGIPDEVQKAIASLHEKKYKKRKAKSYVLGYNCVMQGYFAAIKETLDIGKSLTWPEMQVLFDTGLTSLARRYEQFKKKFPEDAEKIRLLITPEGVSLYEENK